MPRALSAVALLAVTAALAPSCGGGHTNVNGTLRKNQTTAFEAPIWQDPRCGKGANFGNCCHKYDAVCLDFKELVVGDVRVQGDRIVILTYLNDGMGLTISDDRGKTWRNVGIGSIGNIFGFYQAAIYLKDQRVFLMVSREVPRPFGNVYLGQAYEVNLETGVGTMLTGPSIINWTPSIMDSNGDWLSVSFGPEDIRSGANCVALLERWNPTMTDAVRTVKTFPANCPMVGVPGSDATNTFTVLAENNGLNACLWTMGVTNPTAPTAGSQCLSWAEWPAAQSEPMITAAYANERSEQLRPYQRDGQALVMSPQWKKPIALGPGKPALNRGISGRPRYPGMIVVKKDDGTAQLVRVNRDMTTDVVNLPGSPCNAGQYSCFDPDNSDIGRGDYGDALWAEPLGNDEFLMVYVHDFAPGINQVKQTITTSIEKATYTPLIVEGPVADGPAGYPKATKGGPLAAYCARKAACSTLAVGNDWMYSCVGTLMRKAGPGLDAALAAAANAPCDDPIFTRKEPMECYLSGGVPMMDANLQFTCTVGQGLTAADCGTCKGDVAVSCPAGAPNGVSCGAMGKTCAAGQCVAGCTGEAMLMCQGDKGSFCNAGTLNETRCDLLGMSCDAKAQAVGWAPCVSKKAPEDFSTVNMPMKCEGPYLIWHINGTQYLDCTAEGYSGCTGTRCVL